MANKDAIMDKIVRNMKQRGFSTAARTADGATVDGLTVSYQEKDGSSPQIGVGLVDASGSTVLGLGNVTAGSILIEDGSQLTADAIDTAERMTLLSVVSGLANDVVISGTDGATDSIRIAGSADAIGLGE